MVACITCSNLCPAEAVNFVEKGDTPRKKAQKIVKDFQMILKVKNELEQRKVDLDINKKIDQEL